MKMMDTAMSASDTHITYRLFTKSPSALSPNLPGMLMSPTDPARAAAVTFDAPRSTKYGTKCSPMPPLTTDLAMIESVRNQKLYVLRASRAVKSPDKSGSIGLGAWLEFPTSSGTRPSG